MSRGGRWAWVKARFSFRGRASRREFWLTFPLTLLFAVVGVLFTVAVNVGLSEVCAYSHITPGPFILIISLVLVLLTFVLYLWLGAAVAIRRTHDLGFSGRDSLGFRVNVHGGFKRGTIGPNEYGPDPLQKTDVA